MLKEPELFGWLKEFYYPDLTKAKSKFATFDCTSDEHKAYIELKSRNKHYDDLLIEKMKYDAIVEAAAFLELKPLYINSTPEGVYSFNLSSLPDIEWQEKWLPATSEFSSKGNKTKVVGFIHIDKADKL